MFYPIGSNPQSWVMYSPERKALCICVFTAHNNRTCLFAITRTGAIYKKPFVGDWLNACKNLVWNTELKLSSARANLRSAHDTDDTYLLARMIADGMISLSSNQIAFLLEGYLFLTQDLRRAFNLYGDKMLAVFQHGDGYHVTLCHDLLSLMHQYDQTVICDCPDYD